VNLRKKESGGGLKEKRCRGGGCEREKKIWKLQVLIAIAIQGALAFQR
jgi:hypothetical protein